MILFIIIILLILEIVLLYVISKNILLSLENFKEGLLSFFSFLNKETSKTSKINIDSKDEFGKIAINVEFRVIFPKLTYEDAKEFFIENKHLTAYKQHSFFKEDLQTKENFKRLKNNLLETEDKLILPIPCENSDPSWFGFPITCKAGVDRNKIVQYIESKGVQTRMLFAGNLIKHPCFDELRANGNGYRVVGQLTNTDKIMNDTFWVGVYPGMTNEMIDYMSKIIKEAVKIV